MALLNAKHVLQEPSLQDPLNASNVQLDIILLQREPLSVLHVWEKPIHPVVHQIVGYYSISDGSSSCFVCPAGSYSKEGYNNCSICPAGSYSKDGSFQCETCTKGHYSSEGASNCESCEAGSYSDHDGSSSCKKCPSGTFSIDDEMTSIDNCTACQPGTYSNQEGATFFLACDAGYYNSDYGSLNCSKCPTITFWIFTLNSSVIFIACTCIYIDAFAMT